MNSSEHTNNSYKDNEIDLRELFSILWQGKWWIIGITFIFAIGSVAVALYLPNEYKATAIVQPNDSGSGGKLGSLAGQFGGLASLAGVNIGAGESSDAIVAMEVLQSWGFIETFIEKHDIAVPLFAAKKWENGNDTLVYNEKLYDQKQSKWNTENGLKPTSWKLYENFKNRLSVAQDIDTGLISISFTFYSPAIAKEWVDLLIEDINAYMKEKSLQEANSSIQYLEDQITKTSVAEIKSVFGELIQEQHKTKMLAQVSGEYIFKTISAAKTPEEKVKPKRAIIAIIVTLLGGVLSVLFVLIRYYWKGSREE